MASQVVSPAKRYRMSLLLDAYGDLLTEKQRNFLRLYYEEDLSFGEIARDYGVSRQAIFDSVKHGEEALERFEQALRLVATGWVQWTEQGMTPMGVAERLAKVHADLLRGDPDPIERGAALARLGELIEQLRPSPAEPEVSEAFSSEKEPNTDGPDESGFSHPDEE